MTTDATQSRQPAADLIAGECLAVRVRLLNRTITGIYDEALRPLGMTVGQLNMFTFATRPSMLAWWRRRRSSPSQRKERASRRL